MSDGVVFAIIFLGMGLLMLLIWGVFLIIYRKKKKRCSEKVVATIVNMATQKGLSMHGSAAHKVNYHYGIYEYHFNGVTYHNSSIVGATTNPKFGKQMVLFVNPDDPNDFMEKRFATILPMVIFLSLGVVLCLAGIILGICML